MIFHVSKKFEGHLGCKLSSLEPSDDRQLEVWSADLLLIPRIAMHAVVMNDFTLSTLIVPMTHVENFEDFSELFLAFLIPFLDAKGIKMNPFGHKFTTCKRTDRSLIGSMNDAKFLIKNRVEAAIIGSGVIDWEWIQQHINEIPFSKLGYASPDKRLASLAGFRKD